MIIKKKSIRRIKKKLPYHLQFLPLLTKSQKRAKEKKNEVKRKRLKTRKGKNIELQSLNLVKLQLT